LASIGSRECDESLDLARGPNFEFHGRRIGRTSETASRVRIISADDEAVGEPVEVAAYYVVAETLTNTTKHAEASRIDVTVELRDGHLQVSVRDDGVGGADPASGSGLARQNRGVRRDDDARQPA
jgi:signal transduction histidine kinase